jgi:hypothetical protein
MQSNVWRQQQQDRGPPAKETIGLLLESGIFLIKCMHVRLSQGTDDVVISVMYWHRYPSRSPGYRRLERRQDKLANWIDFTKSHTEASSSKA